MKTTARLMTVLVVASAFASGAAPPPTPPGVVALARASQDDSFSELAAGLALEAGHWLVTRSDVVVRMVSDPSAYSNASFKAVNDRLAIDLVVWVDVRGTAAEPVVSYVLETSRGEAGAATVRAQSRDGLPAIPRRIAGDVLSSLKLPTPDGRWPAWPMPAAPAYDAYVRALGRAHTKTTTEADRVALLETVAAAVETYPPAVTELGSAYLDLAGRSSGTAPYYDRSEEMLRRAVQLDPRYPPARQKLASYFAKRGRSEESLKLLQEGVVTHALSPGNHDQLGYILRYAGLMDASIASYRRAQELDGSLENLVATQDQITKSLIYLGRYREALSSHERMESFVARLGRTRTKRNGSIVAGSTCMPAIATRRSMHSSAERRWTQRACGRPLAARTRVSLVAIAMRWRRCWTHSSSTWWWTANGTIGSSTSRPSWGSRSGRCSISRHRFAVVSSMRPTSPVIR
jgi:hypothetical protein